jgi:hypothetical protein
MVTLYTIRFNTQKFYILPTHCMYVFCMDLRTNSLYFPIHYSLTRFVTESEHVYSAVRAGSLSIIPVNVNL